MRLSIFQFMLALGVCALPAVGQAQQSSVPGSTAGQAGHQQAYYQGQAGGVQGQVVGHSVPGEYCPPGYHGHHGGVRPHFQGQMHGHAMPGQPGPGGYGGVPYPKQHAPAAWPYVGAHYPYPQVPMGWKHVTLEWADGWWFLDFDERRPGSGRR